MNLGKLSYCGVFRVWKACCFNETTMWGCYSKRVVAQRTIGCFTPREMCYLNGIQMCLSLWPIILDKPPNIGPVLIEPPLAWAKDWLSRSQPSRQGGAANAVRRIVCLKVASLDVTWCISTKLVGWLVVGDFFDNAKEGLGIHDYEKSADLGIRNTGCKCSKMFIGCV